MLTPKDTERASQEEIGGRFGYRLRPDCEEARQYCYQWDIERPLGDPT